MTNAEILAILRFLEETRVPAVWALGAEAGDPVWLMTIALLRRHYCKNAMTISAVAEASGTPYTTARRHINLMIAGGLFRRRRDQRERKLVYIEPTDLLLYNFRSYCVLIKNQIGSVFGLSGTHKSDFLFGGAHLAANIIAPPQKLGAPLDLEGPLRLLLKDDPTFLRLSRLMPEITASLESQLSLEILNYQDLQSRVEDNASLPISEYDIVAVDMPWLGRLTSKGSLKSLDKHIRKSGTNVFDFYAAAWEGSQYRGQIMGLPFAPTAELFLYRQDIFDAHNLDPPITASQVVAAARKIHAPEKDLYGISWNAAQGQPLGQTFIQVQAAFGQPPVSLQKFGDGFDLNTPFDKLRPTLNNEAGLATVEFLRQLSEVSPPGIELMDWAARTAAYGKGLTAMTYEWSSRTAQFEENLHSPARGVTAYLPHPSRNTSAIRIAPMGGFVLALPANLSVKRVDAAWRTIEWLSSPEFTKMLIKNGSPANFRHSVSADPELQNASPVLRVMQSMEKLGQLQLWPRPPIPSMMSIIQIVGEEVHGAIWGEVSPRHALQVAENRINSQLQNTINI
jgi:multiple sugar transport system substrate-binding protein